MELLKGKTALVTGGTAGIGKAIGALYAKQGAHVAIIGTSRERAETAVREIEHCRIDPSQKIIYSLIDVSKGEEVRRSIQQIFEDWGRIDILVNNAGITRDSLLMKMDEKDWDAVLEVNLKSVYHMCKAVIRPMMKARSGSIINISSVIGLTGNGGQANYAASKAGMIGFTKSVAKEGASRGVRANCIAPGYILTDMTNKLPDSIKEKILGRIPMERMGHPDDIANAALFLASDLASYITGQVVTVDGGMVI